MGKLENLDFYIFTFICFLCFSFVTCVIYSKFIYQEKPEYAFSIHERHYAHQTNRFTIEDGKVTFVNKYGKVKNIPERLIIKFEANR